MSLAAFRPSKDDVRALLRLALPLVAVQVGQTAMGLVDSAMVGHLSADAMAAVALGNIYSFSLLLFGMGILLALDPLISQAVGAGDEPAVARAMQRGIVLALALSVPIALLHLPAEAVLRAAGQKESVVPAAGGFARASIAGIVPFLLVTVMRQALQARHRIRPILIAIVLANLVNAGLDWVLIFGHLGMPSMGAVGSGWATALSRWFLAFCIGALAWPELRPHLRPWRRDTFELAAYGPLVALGLPIGFQILLEAGAFNVAGLVIGTMGATQIDGHQIALQLASLTFMVPLGFGIASSVLVGNAVGRADAAGARRAAGAGLLCGVGFMVTSAAALLAVPGLFAAGFTDDAAVLAVGVTLIPIAGIFQVFDGAQVVSSGILRGAGESRIPAVANFLGYWVVGLPFGWWLTRRMGGDPAGMWWGLTLGLAAVASLLAWRVRHALRGDVRRVEGAA